ncbi:uncharacterized protein LOC141674319 [Apium graveolens]|uniref:uncharacterized protein LOC141674319 n=1 Tax=Apium graveolens TaxID=4045 RepID=UPI003D7A1A62
MAKMLTSKGEGTFSQDASARTESMQSQRLELFPIEHKLEGVKNYLSWSRRVKLILEAKDLEHYIEETCKESKDKSSVAWKTWKTTNSLVVAWMTGSLNPTIAGMVEGIRSAAEIWKILSKQFSGTGNMMIVMDIQDRIDTMKQGEKSIAEYNTELKRIWSKLDYYDMFTITDSAIASIANTWVEKSRVIQLMKCLNSEFETRRTMICHQSPLPRMEEVIEALSQEESRMKEKRHISWNWPLSHDNGRGEGNRSSRGTFRGRARGRGRGHFTGRANLVVAKKSDTGESRKNSELEELRAYKQRMESSNTQCSTYSFLGNVEDYAHAGSGIPSRALASFKLSSLDWIIDSSASKNVKRSSSGFDTYFKYPPSHKETIQTADGSFQPIEGISSVKCTTSLALESVLHIPSFSINLLSVSSIIDQLDCQVIFDRNSCSFQERDTKRTLGTSIRHDGIWYMNKKNDGVALIVTTTEEVEATVMLEHCRLSHVPLKASGD